MPSIIHTGRKPGEDLRCSARRVVDRPEILISFSCCISHCVSLSFSCWWQLEACAHYVNQYLLFPCNSWLSALLLDYSICFHLDPMWFLMNYTNSAYSNCRHSKLFAHVYSWYNLFKNTLVKIFSCFVLATTNFLLFFFLLKWFCKSSFIFLIWSICSLV